MSFDMLPVWAMGASLAAHLAAGAGLGFVYFNAIRWNVGLFVQGRRPGMGIALIMIRLVLLGGVLTLASREGAMPLLALAAGLLIARPMAMRRNNETAT